MYGLLRDAKLERYYDLRGSAGTPVADVSSPTRSQDSGWIEPLEQSLAIAAPDALTRVRLDIQGVQCTACVWLNEQLFSRHPGACQITMNPTLGTIDAYVRKDFPLREWIREVQKFGYLLGPALKSDAPKQDDSSPLLLRMGITIALAMNSMIFALSLYLGLEHGPIWDLMHWAGYGLATLAVIIGGQVFFQSAWQALRRGILHMDVPIALGILASFLGATWSFFWGDRRASYFDTITIFIALMLVGRWLQERVIARNRKLLLADDGVESLTTRRVVEGRVETIAARAIDAGDALLLAPGDLVPVDGTLVGVESAAFSLDWINGESAPRLLSAKESVPAGAFLAGSSPVTLKAETAFATSAITSLLRQPLSRDPNGARTTEWWQLFARVYVTFVLLVASGTGLAWWFMTHDVTRTLDVVTGLLVVTCPCALGIATPLAYELVLSNLRKRGLFVRAPGFLDRALAVKKVVFDKTGTLTTGALSLARPEELRSLTESELCALYTLATSSSHPKSAAVARAIESVAPGTRRLDGILVEETTGRGVGLSMEGVRMRLGAPGWAAIVDGATAADLVFGVAGKARLSMELRETEREDAGAEIARLQRDGFDVWMLSGDEAGRVERLAKKLGIPADHALAGRKPEGKAAWLAEHDHKDTLMIGDGINDSLVVGSAHCSGTPAVDRPFMPARSDFYFVTPGLAPIGLALRASLALRRVTKRNLCAAALYNLFVVSLCMAGLMRPWLAAVLMPASSLLVIFATIASLSRRSSLWKS